MEMKTEEATITPKLPTNETSVLSRQQRRALERSQAKKSISTEGINKISRTDRRQALRNEKKKVKKKPMKDKNWSDLEEIYKDIKSQMADTRTEVIETARDPVLDVGLENISTVTNIREKASNLEEALNTSEAMLDAIHARHSDKAGKPEDDDAFLYDDIHMEYMEFQLTYLQSIIPVAADVACSVAEHIESIEKLKEANNSQQPEEVKEEEK